jgi:hypothetical protein
LVWLNFPTAYSFVMISPNLYAIRVFLLMNLSQDLKLVLLRYLGLGDGYSLKGSKNKPSRHSRSDFVRPLPAGGHKEMSSILADQ